LKLVALLITLFSLTSTGVATEVQLSSDLISKLKQETPWLILGFVSDSETQSSITSKGQGLRKEIEQQIQSMGGEVLPIPLSQRMKLERMWSLPFTGAFSKELKQEASELKANLLSGTFHPQASAEVQILTFNIDNKKTLIHYCDTMTPAAPNGPEARKMPLLERMQPQTSARTQRTSQSTNPLADSPWGFETFEPTRQKPDERARRRTRNPRATEARAQLIHDHLNHSKVLTQFKMEHQQKSTDELISIRNDLIHRAQSSFMTSSKIELYSRAHAINTLIQPVDEATEKELLERLLDHQEFFLERKN
jgi:hypothetical protein